MHAFARDTGDEVSGGDAAGARRLTSGRPAAAPQSEALESLIELAGQHDCRLAVDIATGAGATAFALTGVARRVLALATSAAALTTLRHAAAARGVAHLCVVRAAGGRLPLADGVADLVTCRAAPPSLHGVRGALDEIVRVLAPGGVFLLTDTDQSEDEWLGAAFTHDGGAPGRSPASWCRLLEEHGLTVDTTLTTRRPPSGRRPRLAAAGEAPAAPERSPELSAVRVHVQRGAGPTRDETLADAGWSNAIIRARRSAEAPPQH